MFNVKRIIYSFYGVKSSSHEFSAAAFILVQISVLPDHSHSSRHAFRSDGNFVSDFNLRRAFVRVSLRGVCKSVGLCFSVLMSMYRRALHSSPQSAVGKILWTFQCPFQQPLQTKKTKQGITFGLWLLSALSPSKVFLTCISDSYANETKNTALDGKTHLFKECTFKLLREIVEAPSWFLVSISCLCLKFHVVTCKKAECNLTWFCFVAISYNVAVVLWQSMKFYTKLFIVSVGSKAQISLGFKLSCF